MRTLAVFFFCVDLCDLWEKYSRAVWTIQHSQHSSPKYTLFFSTTTRSPPNTPFLAHLCNRLTFK